MTNRYLDRQVKREKIKYHGAVSEKKNIKKMGGRQTPGSGNIVSAKSDGYTPMFQYENKSTIHESFKLERGVLEKILQEARQVNRIPALLLSFVMGSGKSKSNGDFVILCQTDFIALLEEAYGDSCKFV